MFHNGYADYNSKIATRHPAMHTDMLGQMLHYLMTRRAPDIDIIEEPGILLDQELLLPQNNPLPFRFESGLHQAISVEL